MLPLLNAEEFIVPHRMIPMPTRPDFDGIPELSAALGRLEKTPSLDTRKAEEGYSRLLDVFDVNEHQKETTVVDVYGNHGDGSTTKCCIDRGNCTSRDHWVPYLDRRVALLRVAPDRGSGLRGLAFVAGEGNVQHNPPTIRACTVTNAPICP